METLKNAWPWLKWVALVLLVMLSVLLVTQTYDYLHAHHQQRKLQKAVNNTVQVHQQRHEANQAARQENDSAYFLLLGRRQQLDDQALPLKLEYEKRLRSLPAPPELSAHPPRP